MDSYIFVYLVSIYSFSSSLKPCNTQNRQHTKYSVSQPYFIFHCKLSKINLDFISELINLKYAFNIPFKITLKTIIIGNFSQLHDGTQLNVLPTLSSEILLLNWVEKKTFMKAWSSLLNNNGNLHVQFN